MNKLNVVNLLVLIVFLLSMGLIIYDLITIIMNFNSTWTLFGIIIFFVSAIVAELSYEYLSKKKRK